MRALFPVVSLALVLVALPAAQAEACLCDRVEQAEGSCGCCCAAAERACTCCPTDAEERPERLDGACPCSVVAPQAPAPATDELPQAEALAPVPEAAAPRTGRAHVAATVERRDPHPAVSLPLLL
jgi:hypothetical protein